MEDIKRHWDSRGLRVHVLWDSRGLRVHVLDHEMTIVVPCVEFFVGNDPQQQHRQDGLQEGNCSHSCTYFTYLHNDR